MMAEGYTAPRRSVARILMMQPDERTRLLMVGISIIVGTLGFALMGHPEGGPEGRVILGYLVTVVAGLLQYYGIAWIIGIVCGATGGEGTREDSRTLVAWWALVTSPLPVIMMAALRAGQSPGAALVLIGAAVLSFVLLAAFIAETHRYTSTARVCGAMMALLMIFSFVLSSILPMPVPA